jgi:CRISPR-associated protein Csb2
MDHVLVHAPMGFDSDPNDGALRALGAIRKIWAKNLPDVFVVLAGTGVLSDFEKAVPLVRRSSMFRSWTPFVPPRHPKEKGKDTLLGQVQAELATRGLPTASGVDLQIGPRQWAALDDLPPSAHAWPKFRGYARRRASRPPPVDIGLSLRLVFDCEVRGPITLGYGSHFGLGAFEPWCETDPRD